MSLCKGSLITGDVTQMAFGGAGIVRHQNVVIFVPFTAIGDKVSVKLTRIHKNFAEAELVDLLEAAPSRTAVKCPYFGTCGGCQLQHIDYVAQLKSKQTAVQDALQRIGKFQNFIVEPIEPATQRWYYRRHVRLHLKIDNEQFKAGYIDRVFNLLPITSCPIFIEEESIFIKVHQFVKQLSTHPFQEGSLSILKNTHDNSFLLFFQFDKALPSNFKEKIKEAREQWPEWKGIICHTPDTNDFWGETTPLLPIEGLNIFCSADAFLQNHAEQSLSIYRAIGSYFVEKKARHVLDLYCGIGITTLLLAKEGIKVIGIEQNQRAIQLAKQSCAYNALSVEFLQADVKEILLQRTHLKQTEGILVNPPRIGLDPEVLHAIGQSGASSIVYVSCMPATLARDLNRLQTYGYTLKWAKPYDMFPQTGHVETMAILERLH